MIPAPPPGVYPGIPAENYHQWDAFSNSMASMLAVSPKCLKDYKDNGPDDATPSQDVGTASHSLILERSLSSRCYVAKQCQRILASGENKGKPCSNQGFLYGAEYFCKKHSPANQSPSDLIRLTQVQFDLCNTLHNSVSSHPWASRLIKKACPSNTEVSIVWECRTTGVLCKARVDLLLPEIGIMADLKTCADCSRREFEKSNFNFGYYRQAAHYLDGAETLEIPVKRFVNIAAEKQRPYDVACYMQGDDAIDAGRTQMLDLRARYRECLKRNEWPGVADDIIIIGIPTWAKAQLEREAA